MKKIIFWTIEASEVLFQTTRLCLVSTMEASWAECSVDNCDIIKSTGHFTENSQIDSHSYQSNGMAVFCCLLEPFANNKATFWHSITRQIWGIWKLRPAYSPETPNLAQNQWCFVSCDLEIWWMTLENNRASLLCCFTLCATFHSHRWIRTGVTVRKRPIWVKFDDF